MGLADCINLVDLTKILEKPFKRKLGPLPDTLQAGACVFLPFQNVFVSRDHVPLAMLYVICMSPDQNFEMPPN